MQFEALPQGPKLIAGDLDGTPEAFQTIGTLTIENGWADVGMASNPCGGAPGQTACRSKDTAKESRVDYFFATEWLFPAIATCRVDNCGDYPTHRPLIIEANVDKMEKATRERQPATNYAELMEEKIQERLQEAKS